MLKIFGQVFHHDVELFLEHGLDYELLIMRKKEETPRLPLRLTSLKNGLIVQLG